MAPIKLPGVLSVLQMMRSMLHYHLMFERRSKARSRTGCRWDILLLLITIHMSMMVEGSMLDFIKPAARKISDVSRKKGTMADNTPHMIGHRLTREVNHETSRVSPQESRIKQIGQMDQKEWKSARSQDEILPQSSTSIKTASRPPKYPKDSKKSWQFSLPTGTNNVRRPTQQNDLIATTRISDGKHRPIGRSSGSETHAVENPPGWDFSFPVWHWENEQDTSRPKYRRPDIQKDKGYWEYSQSNS
ncbi:hypothetical protein DFH28DRAFT_959455 [Melampsora americana]|nr:hypothetical protein DFH28DRAFT_959455 [Melampsora americana]